MLTRIASSSGSVMAIIFFVAISIAGLLYGLSNTVESAAPTPPEYATITIIKEADPADGTDFAFSSNLPISESVMTINTVAGSGNDFSGGYGGDGGPATTALMNFNPGIDVDETGNLYIADFNNNRVRKVIASSGIITTVAGNGLKAVSGDGGPATSASLKEPLRVTVDITGNLYIVEFFSHRIRMVDATTGVITTVVGTGSGGFSGDGGLATEAQLNAPYGVEIDSAGNLYIADLRNNRIRRVDAVTGIISTVAGNGQAGFSGDGGLATNARLNRPFDLSIDGADNIYIADSDNQRVRKVIASTGIITTVAGNGSAGFSGDGGLATGASLNGPNGIGVDNAGNLHIADYNNNRIRRVDANTGIINTVAGTGASGFSGDAGLAANAKLRFPYDVAVTDSGNFFVADSGNNRIRKVFESSFILDHAVQDDGDAFGNSQIFSDLLAGSYTFTETMAPTWRLNHIQCDNGSWQADLSIASLTIEISSGENITCTFSNNLLPDLVMFKFSDSQTVYPGEALSYTLGYLNIGHDVTNAVLTETVPVHTTFDQDGSTPGWSCLPDHTAGSVCTLAIGDVAYGPPAGIVHFVVTVDSPLALGVSVIENSAAIGDDGLNGPDQSPSDNSATETTPVNHHGVKLSGNDGQPVLAGVTVTYTLAITNSGVVKDIFDLALSGNNWPSNLLTDTVKLAAGFSATFQMTVSVPAKASYLEQDKVIITAISQGDSSQKDTTSLTTTALWDHFELYMPMIVNNKGTPPP